MLLRSLPRFGAALALSLVAAGTAHAQRVQMPVGYRLTWIGARWNPGARVVDARTGRPIATTLSYRVADPEIANVTPRGDVTARKPGRTRLWAVAGRDSASALIVVEQWPARFTFSPNVLRFDAENATQPLRVLASDSAGVPIVGGTSRVGACRSLNERVARLVGETVTSISNGTTWIRCSDRGIADSIRIDVQQRPTSAIITNKVALRSRVAGDTFSVRVSARDRNQREVSDARPTWASLTPSVVSVDPVTGRARALSNGDARVIAQVGDVADSVIISVTGTLFQAPVAVLAADTTTKPKATLYVPEVFLYEGDTAFVDIKPLDATGAAVSLADLTVRLRDTTVASRIDTARFIGRKSGSSYLVVQFGDLVDSALVNVRQRLSGSAASSTTEGSANRAAFRAPEIPDSTALNLERRRATERAIQADSSLNASRQNMVFSTNAVGAIAEYLSRTDAGVIEDRTGPLYGGAGTLLLYQRLELAGTLRVGSLTSVDTLGENLKFTELETSAGIFPVKEIGLRAGVILRGSKSDIAAQTWFIPKVSLVTRFSFIGDVFNTFAAFSVMPRAQFSGIDERGSLVSRGGEAGVEFKLPGRAGFNGGATYFVEQLTFNRDDAPRIDSFSAIRLRFGFNLGR